MTVAHPLDYESERDGVPLVEEEDAAGVRQDDSKVDALLDDENDEEIISIFSTADKRRLFVVEDIIKACAGCRPSFLFTGYVIEQAPGTSLPSSYRLTPKEKTIERDLTLSLRYEPPSPKFSRSCPTSTSYRLKVSRGSDFLYLTRGLTKKIRVNKSELVVTWGNLELAFANTEELGIFVSALKYVDFVEDNNTSSSGNASASKTEEEGRGKMASESSSSFLSSLLGAHWAVPASISIALVAVVSYQYLKKKTS